MGTFSNTWSNTISGTTATAQDIGHRRVVRAVRPMDIDDEKDDKRVYRKRDLEPPVLTLADAANHNTNQFQANKRVRHSSNSGVAVPRFTDYGFTNSQVSHHGVTSTSAPTTRTFRRATRPTSAPVSKPSIPSAGPMAPPPRPFSSTVHTTNPFTGYSPPMANVPPTPPFATAPPVERFSNTPNYVRETQATNPFAANRPPTATQVPTPPFRAAPKIPSTTTQSNGKTHATKPTSPNCPPSVQAKMDDRNEISLKIDKYQLKIDDINEAIVLESMGQGMNHTKFSSSKCQKEARNTAADSISVVQRGMMMKRDKLVKRMQMHQQQMTNLTMEINKEMYGNYFHSS